MISLKVGQPFPGSSADDPDLGRTAGREGLRSAAAE